MGLVDWYVIFDPVDSGASMCPRLSVSLHVNHRGRLASLILKLRVDLASYHGAFAPIVFSSYTV